MVTLTGRFRRDVVPLGIEDNITLSHATAISVADEVGSIHIAHSIDALKGPELRGAAVAVQSRHQQAQFRRNVSHEVLLLSVLRECRRVIDGDLDHTRVLEDLGAVINGVAGIRIVMLTVEADVGLDASGVDGVTDCGLVVNIALRGCGADARNLGVHDMLRTKEAERLRTLDERLRVDVVNGGRLGEGQDPSVGLGRPDAGDHAVIVHLVLVEIRENIHQLAIGQRDRRTRVVVGGRRVESRQDGLIDLLVRSLHAALLKDAAAVGLASENVPAGLGSPVVHFLQRDRHLGVGLVGGGDKTIDATFLHGVGLAGDEEDGGITLDHCLGRYCIAEIRLANFEARHELVAIQSLHWHSHCSSPYSDEVVGEASVLGCPNRKGLVGCLAVHEPLNGAKTSALIQMQGRSAGCLLTLLREEGSRLLKSSENQISYSQELR